MGEIKAKYQVSEEMRGGVEAGEEGLPRFAQENTFEDALMYSKFLDKLYDGTWFPFVGCQGLVRFRLRKETRAEAPLEIVCKKEPEEGRATPKKRATSQKS